MSRDKVMLRSYCNQENLKNSIDIYGQNFYLSFKGQQTFNTSLGAIVTILIYAMFAPYVLYRFSILVMRSDISTVTNSYFEKLNYTDPAPMKLDELDFQFAFTVSGNVTPRFGSIRLLHQATTKDAVTGQKETVKTEIEIEECGLDGLNYDDKDEIQSKGIDKFFCPKNLTGDIAKIRGIYYALIFERISIQLIACDNSTNTDIICASEEEQREFFRFKFFGITFVNRYFDSQDLYNPVKKYLDTQYFEYLNIDQQTLGVVGIYPSQASLSQSLLPLFSPETINFAEYSDFSSHKLDVNYYGQRMLMYFEIRAIEQSKIYSRTIYSFMDFCSDIGGLFSTLFIFGKILVGFYLDKLFYSAIIRQLFQTKVEENSIKSFQTQHMGKIQSKSQETLQKQPSFGKQPLNSHLINEILSRKRFNYSLKDILQSQAFFLICCCNKKTLKHQKRQTTLFKKAIEKVDQNFDALSLFRMMRQFKLISKVLMTQQQKLLLQFQQSSRIDIESIYESDCSFKDEQEELTSNNPYKRLNYVLNISNHVQKFLDKSPQSVLDKRLLSGMFLKRKRIIKQREKLKKKLTSEMSEFLSKKKNKIAPKETFQSINFTIEEEEKDKSQSQLDSSTLWGLEKEVNLSEIDNWRT